jgi:hypothetical protein
MLRWPLLLALGGLGLVVAAGAGTADSRASSEPAQTDGPWVICITSDYGEEPVTGAYRHRPRTCLVRDRNSDGVFGYNSERLKQMRWLYWRTGQAFGKGRIVISTVGPARAKVRLTKPRSPCGRRVYTKATIRYRFRFDGERHTGRGTLNIDDCLT